MSLVVVDGEAALAAARERAASAEGKGYMVDKAALKELFLGLGYDKVTTEDDEAVGDEEGEDQARPPPKEEVTDYAGEAPRPSSVSQSPRLVLL